MCKVVITTCELILGFQYLLHWPQGGDDLNQFIKITDLNQFKSAIKITIKIKYSLTAILCNCSLVFTCQNASINKQTIVSSYITYIMT